MESVINNVTARNAYMMGLTVTLQESAIFSMTSTALIILPMVTVRRDVIMPSAAGMEVTAQDTRAPEGK